MIGIIIAVKLDTVQLETCLTLCLVNIVFAFFHALDSPTNDQDNPTVLIIGKKV